MKKPEKRLLTVKDVAAYLQVNPTTIYRLLRSSKIPAFKVGGDWRFNIESIDAWRRGAEGRSASRPRPEGGPPTQLQESSRSHRRAGDLTSLSMGTGAPEMPAVLARLSEMISQMVAPPADLQAIVPVLRRIANAIEDRHDAASEIEHLYEGQPIPLRARSESLLEFAPLPFRVSDRTRRLVSFNDAYRRLFEFTSATQLRKVLLTDLVDPADVDRYATLNRRFLSGEVKSATFLAKGLTAEGRPIVLRSQVWGVCGKPSRRPEYVAAVMERLTDQQEAAAMLTRCAEDLSKRREKILAG